MPWWRLKNETFHCTVIAVHCTLQRLQLVQSATSEAFLVRLPYEMTIAERDNASNERLFFDTVCCFLDQPRCRSLHILLRSLL
jgi:hypothetical protein